MDSSRVLSMRWEDGLFAHWPVDPALVAETLPEGLDVATYDGDAWLGVVPFVMADIRPRGVPRGLTFPELNLRTYVERDGRKGVYFYNLDADDRLGVTVARRLFALPYYRARMRVRRDGDDVTFTSRRTHEGVPPARFDATYRPTGEPFTPEPGSLASFLVENYRFYTAGRRLYAGDIHHEPWTLRPGEADIRANSLFAASGFDRPEGEPLVYCADTLDVEAGRLRTVE
jgi:hypothetical protein